MGHQQGTQPRVNNPTKGKKVYTEPKYKDGDFLVFGKETKGLPEDLLYAHSDNCLRIPIISEARSLNLSNSVAIVVLFAVKIL